MSSVKYTIKMLKCYIGRAKGRKFQPLDIYEKCHKSYVGKWEKLFNSLVFVNTKKLHLVSVERYQPW